MVIKNLYQVDCLSLLCLVLFLEFCLIPSFGTYSSVSSFCLTLCFISMHWTGWLYFLSLRKWPYVGDVLCGLTACSLLVTRAICFRGASYVGLMGLSGVVGQLL